MEFLYYLWKKTLYNFKLMLIKKNFFKNKKQHTIELNNIMSGKNIAVFIFKDSKCTVRYENKHGKNFYEIVNDDISVSTTSEKKVLSYLQSKGFI